MILDREDKVNINTNIYLLLYLIILLLFGVFKSIYIYFNLDIIYYIHTVIGKLVYIIDYCIMISIILFNHSIVFTLLYILYSKDIRYKEVFNITILEYNYTNLLLYIILLYQLITFICTIIKDTTH